MTRENEKLYDEVVDKLLESGTDMDTQAVIASMLMDIARSLAVIADALGMKDGK